MIPDAGKAAQPETALHNHRSCDQMERLTRELLEALQDAHTHLIGMAAYLATCSTDVIVENLETTIAALHNKAEKFEAAIAKARKP